MNADHLHNLINGLLDDQLSDSEQAELIAMLRTSAAARRVYWELVQQDSLLQDVVRESAGRDLARLAADDLAMDQSSATPLVRAKTPSASGMNHRFAITAILLASVIGIVLGGSLLWSKYLPTKTISPGEAFASLRSLAGEVRLTDAHQHSVTVASGHQFFTGDTLHVGDDGEAEVILTDGSRLVLRADSVLNIPAAGNSLERRVHLERGAADVEAARQLPNNPLILSTQQARLVVLGTRFRLYAGTGDSRVELQEGKVQFERKSDGESVEVASGQYAIAGAGDERSQPLVAQPLDAAWRLRQTLLRAGRRVAFSHSGSWLATASHAHLKTWNIATGEVVHSLKTTPGIDSLAFNATDEALFTLTENGQAQVWQLAAPAATVTELKCDGGVLRRCAVSRSGRWLAQTSSVEAGYLPLWKVDASGAISLERSLAIKMGSVALAETEAGAVVAASQWNGTTVIWDAATGEELSRYRFRSELYALELSLDGRLFAGFGNTEGLLLVDTESGQSRYLWPPGSVRVNELRFTADGQSLFAAMNDGVVRAWSTADGRPLLVLSTGDSHLSALDVSADGKWLSTAGDDGNIKIWQRELK